MLRTCDSVSYGFDLSHSIGQIPFPDVVEGSLEELSLKNGRDIGDDNDEVWVQWLLA